MTYDQSYEGKPPTVDSHSTREDGRALTDGGHVPADDGHVPADDGATAGIPSRAIDVLPVRFAVFDEDGTIVESSGAWREFVEHERETIVTEEIAEDLSAVFQGERDFLEREYSADSADDRWFLFRAVACETDGSRYVAVIHVDITERKATERTVEQFRHAVEQAGSAVFFTDLEGTIEYVNPAFERLTGYEAEEAIGRNPRILKSGKLPEAYYERMWDTVLDGEVWREEVPNNRADGEMYYANQTIAPITDETGEAAGFVAIQNDVTEQKTADRERKLYDEILQQLEDPVMVQDCDGKFVMLNDAVSEHAELPREELLGRDEFAFMDVEAAAFVAEQKREVLESEEPAAYEVSPTFEGEDGKHSFSTLRYPYYDEEGNLAGTFAICRDFTELKRRERELEQYKSAVEGAYDLIAACDIDERLLFANQPYCTFHGIQQDEVGEFTVSDVVSEEAYPMVSERIDQVLAGEAVKYRMRRTDSDRGERILDIRYYPINGEEGPIRGAVSIIRDVTEQAERNRHLQVVDRILRHNLRNELNVVYGRAVGIRDRTDGELAREAEAIIEPTERLLETAEKSRSITEHLREPARREPIDVATGCRNAASWLRNRYPNASVEIVAPSSAVVYASANVGEAIDELLENAVVHADGEQPSIALRVTVATESVHVSIRDENSPISEMDRAVLEEGRAPKQLSHGSGLGLWLVYWTVNRSGGSIAVRQVDSRGNLVTVELPLESGDARRSAGRDRDTD